MVGCWWAIVVVSVACGVRRMGVRMVDIKVVNGVVVGDKNVRWGPMQFEMRRVS